MLREYGFGDVETQFTEWNYSVPGMGSRNRRTRRAAYERSDEGPGAAFAASTLAYMQQTGLDLACYYCAFGSVFKKGFIDIYGVPNKPYDTFVAFHQLVACGQRIAVSGNRLETGLAISAAANVKGGTTAVLLSNFEDEASGVVLAARNHPFRQRLYCTEYVIDDERALTRDREQILSSDARIRVSLPKGTVRLLMFTRHPAPSSLAP